MFPGHRTEKLLVKNDAGLYHFINQGCLVAEGIDDKEEMEVADVCMRTTLDSDSSVTDIENT